MTQIRSPQLRRLAAAFLMMASAAVLAGCQQRAASLEGADTLATGSIEPGSYKEATRLSEAFQADPRNAAKGLAYADALGRIGQTDKQLEILKQVFDANPGNASVRAIYAKKLVAAGRGGEAIPILEGLTASAGADWRLHSALGSAYDQNGQFDQARTQYNAALAQKPGELSVLNNLGMSYALQGDLKTAEATLRKASQAAGATSNQRIRQNLALVVGLQGRFDEARQIASADLPPDQVEANLAYLKKMLSQSNTWQQLSEPAASG